MSNPRDLFLQLAGELLWAERMLAFETLPKLHGQVRSQGLAQVVAEHLEETREHATRLEQVFRALGAEPSSNLNPPAEKLAQHHDELAADIANERLADVFHAAAATTTERLEIASYETLLTLGRDLELGTGSDLLLASRDEEVRALERLREELERLTAEVPR